MVIHPNKEIANKRINRKLHEKNQKWKNGDFKTSLQKIQEEVLKEDAKKTKQLKKWIK